MERNMLKKKQPPQRKFGIKVVTGRRDIRAGAYSAPGADHPKKLGRCSFTRRRGTETYTARPAANMRDA